MQCEPLLVTLLMWSLQIRALNHLTSVALVSSVFCFVFFSLSFFSVLFQYLFTVLFFLGFAKFLLNWAVQVTEQAHLLTVL